nr:reverse transcriptase domain-containing protein [Tanacetum cinerariifolium]
MIRVVRINVPFIDVLAEMPNYGKVLKELISNKHKTKQISAPFLSDESSAMIQNKVPPKLEDPESFLIPFIRVKLKQLNLGVRTERMIFNIDSAIKHSYSNDDTCFIINVIDDAFLDEGSKILYSIKGTLFEEEIFAEFDEFMAMTADENSDSGSDTEEPPFKKITINTKYKIKTSLEEPLTDLELKPLPDNLEYVFLEELSFLPKGGITVVTNAKDELVPTRTVTGWRVCIDYHKLNEATAKDHYPLPFMDQMLERLAGNKYFYLLDGFSGYFQIPIDPNDQEKIALTCPYGTYAYRRMPFGLCNAPATFQRCILAIFYDMIEESVEVFMDDFSVFRNSFETCLNNLDKMLQNAHLVLNSEKCNFMVKERIVLGHKVSSRGLEVNKEKINVISKLPPPTNIKDTTFEFDDECQKAFKLLKEKLTCAPVILSPNWNLPFERMCDASDFTIILLQEFDIEIKDRKGTNNVAADHLPRIKNDESSDDSEVDDNFPRETLMEINTKDEPWFADFANYLVSDIIPKGMTYQQKKKFFSDLKHYFWEEPYLFKVCSNGMIKRCISGQENQTILDQCHHGPTGGHYGPNLTAKKVLDSGFYWPTIIKEAHTLVRLYEACQKTCNISKRDEMPLYNI